MCVSVWGCAKAIDTYVCVCVCVCVCVRVSVWGCAKAIDTYVCVCVCVCAGLPFDRVLKKTSANLRP